MAPTTDPFADLTAAEKALVNGACAAFEAALLAGARPSVAAALAGHEGAVRAVLLRELVILAAVHELRGGGAIDAEALLGELPDDRAAALAALAEARRYADLGPGGGDDGPEGSVPLQPVGRFLPVRVLGSGAFGVVLLALDPEAGCEVALKVPHLATLFSPELRRRFLREAEVATALDHPNLVRVREAGEAGLVCYIARDFVDGVTLEERLGERRARGEPFTPPEAAGLVKALAEAVHHAHERGVLHCDLKPANVLLPAGREDHPLVADFGLARLVGDPSGLTVTGQVLGTPAYMAPEQAAGRRRDVTARTDVHALGAVLYELLAGRPPFAAPSLVEALSRVINTEPAALRTVAPCVPADLETVCHCCLEKEPARRYPTALALAEDLGRFLGGRPPAARPAGWPRRAARWVRSHRLASLMMTFAALSVAALVGGLAMHNRELRAEKRAARAAEARAQQRLRELRRVLAEVVRLPDLLEGRAFYLNSARLAALRLVAEQYKELLREHPEDNALAAEVARLLTEIGSYEGTARNFEAGLESYRQARELWGAVCRREPDDLAHRVGRARCLSGLAGQLQGAGRPEEAAGAGREALRAWEALGGEVSAPEDRALFTQTAQGLGSVLAALGRAEAGRAEVERARARMERWCREDPTSRALQSALGSALLHEAGFHLNRGDEAAAVRCWREAFALGRKLGGAGEAQPSGLGFFGEACLALVGRPDLEPFYSLCVEHAERKLQELEWHAAGDPGNAGLGALALDVARGLARAHLRAGHADRAQAAAGRAARVVARLAAGGLPAGESGLAAAECLLSCAELRLECRQLKEALALSRQARDLLARWAGGPADGHTAQRGRFLAGRAEALLRRCGEPAPAPEKLNGPAAKAQGVTMRPLSRVRPLVDQASLHLDRGQKAQALASARAARDLLLAWCKAAPGVVEVASAGGLAAEVSAYLRKGGAPAEGHALLEAVLPLAERAARRRPDDLNAIIGLAIALDYQGRCLQVLKRNAEMERAWACCADFLRRGLERHPGNATCREMLARRYSALGAHCAEEGRAGEARRWLIEAGRLRPKDPQTRHLAEEAWGRLGDSGGARAGTVAGTSPSPRR